MSGDLAGAVWRSALDPRWKPLAALLADIANDDGSCIYPSISYISWKLGDDPEPSEKPRMERTVQRGMKALKGMGVLIFIGYRRYNPNSHAYEVTGYQGRTSLVEYRMIADRLPTRTPWREKGDNLSQPALERVTNGAKKGDKPSTERVTNGAKKGVTGVTRNVREKRQLETSDRLSRADAGESLDPAAVAPEDEDNDVSFASEYVKAHRRLKGTDHPGAATVAAAMQLERDYGRAACLRAAADFQWEKHPNYLRPVLEERKNVRTTSPVRNTARQGARGAALARNADVVAGWERYAAGEV